MKAAATMFVLLALTALPLATHAGPIDKVIQMISELQAKVLAEGKASQKVYDEFAEWCEDKSKNLMFDIKTGKAEAADLKATIGEDTATIASLETKVEELSGQIATAEADLKAATHIRNTEAEDYAAESKELMEIIDTLERAVGILEREMAKGGASASMLQMKSANSITQALEVMVKASVLSSADGTRLTALVQSSDSDDDAALGAPDPTVYEGHSGGIIEVLNGLLEKAQAQLDTAQKTENTSNQNFQMLKQSLEDEIKFANKDLAEAKKGIAEASESKATAEGDLSVTSKDLAEDMKALDDLHHNCMTKAEDFEEEMKDRNEELKALATAKKIIIEATSLEQVSFLQTGRSNVNFEAVRFIRDLARKEKAPALAQLASQMASAVRYSASAGEDPFAKIKGLIMDMIEKLEKEAEEDATKKAYCDKELSESNASKDEKTTDIEKLSTKIDSMSANSAQLKEEVAGLQKALAELTSSQAEMDKLRQEEKAVYDESSAELEKGLEGIKLALKVLREYYGKKEGGAGGGIISLLEVCESDFSKDLAETNSKEETAVAAYEQETKENEIEKTTKEQDVKYKTKEATGLDKAISEATGDRTGIQTELDAVNEYLKKLEDECVAKPETYGERKRRREAEIAGLKNALEILEGEAVLLQKTSKRQLRGVQLHGSA